MGLLSAFPFAQAAGYGPGWADYQRRQQQQRQPIQYAAARPPVAPQLPSLTGAPNGQPMGPDPFAAAPIAPSVQAMPPMKEGPTQDPGAQTGFFGRLNKGFGSLNESPLFSLGMSLLGNAQGSNWGGVGQDMRQFGQDQTQRQRMQNEDRRLKTADSRDETVFGRQQQDWARQDRQTQSLEQWIATLPPEQQVAARANPEAAHGAYMEAQANANAPITPYQQAQLDLESRGQNMSYSAQMANLNRDRPLRGPDASLLTDVRESAARTAALSQLGGSFMELNGPGGTGTGADRRFNPFNQFDSGYQTMNSVVSQMIPFMRAPGSGATSDYEQQLYQRGVQSPTNSPAANWAIYRNQQALANIAQQRRYFYEEYASNNGTLNGAEQAFQSSPQFQQITRANPMQQQAPASAPSGGQQPAGGGITPEQARAELRRREAERRRNAAGNQPGGYTGR